MLWVPLCCPRPATEASFRGMCLVTEPSQLETPDLMQLHSQRGEEATVRQLNSVSEGFSEILT